MSIARASTTRGFARHRVDPHTRPREIGERQPGHDAELDPPLAEQHDGALGDRGIAGHRVDDGALLRRSRVDDLLDHPRVGRFEIGRPVVDIVEGGEAHPVGFELHDGGMPARPHEARGRRLERVARGGDEVVGPRGTEPDDGEPGHSTTAARGAGPKWREHSPAAGTLRVSSVPTSRSARRS